MVAVGTVAIIALAGCRTNAGTAAYVGDTRITDATVDKTADSVTNVPGYTPDALRANTLADLTFIEIAKRYAKAKGYAAPTVTADQLDTLATQVGVAPDRASTNAFVVATVTARSWANLLLDKTTAVRPTDAELLEIYQRAVAQGVADPNTFDTLKPQIAAVDGLGAALALRRELLTRMRQDGVTTSPRYRLDCPSAPCRPIAFPLLILQGGQGGSVFNAVVLPLSTTTGSPAVVDAPVTIAPSGN